MATTETTKEIIIDADKVREAFEYVHQTPFDEFRKAELAAIGVDNPLLEQEVKRMFSAVIYMGQEAAYRMMTGQLAGHHVLAACAEGEMPRISMDRIKDVGDAVVQFPPPPLWLSAEDRELVEPSISQIFGAQFDESQVLADLCSQLTHRHTKEGMHWMFMVFKPYILEP